MLRHTSTSRRIVSRKGARPGEFSPTADHRQYEPQKKPLDPPRVHMKPIIDKTLVACARAGVRSFLPAARTGEKRATFVIHPSQAGGCRRKAFFGFVHAPRDPQRPDPRLQRIFDVGHEGHRRIQGYLFEAWKRGIGDVSHVWEDVKLEIPELCIIGELDCVFEILGKYRVLVEIKTAARSTFDSLRKPKEDWVWQAHIYMKAVGLRAAIVFVECKDNQEAKEFWIPFDDELWERIDTACVEMIVHSRTSVITNTKDTSACRFCDYQGVCKSNGEGINWKKIRQKVVYPKWALD